jgi:hypothetical protein
MSFTLPLQTITMCSVGIVDDVAAGFDEQFGRRSEGLMLRRRGLGDEILAARLSYVKGAWFFNSRLRKGHCATCRYERFKDVEFAAATGGTCQGAVSLRP